jgi:hypothetical protein
MVYVALQAGVFVAVNAVTIFIFLKKPFLWPDDSTARFMW